MRRQGGIAIPEPVQLEIGRCRPAGGGHPEISLVRRELIKMPVQFPGHIGNMDDGTTAVMVSLAVTV